MNKNNEYEEPNMTNKLLPGYIYKEEIKKTEHLVNIPEDSFYQVDMEHPIFNPVYLYALLPVFSKLDFVSNAYIAQNGLLRLNIKGKPQNFFEDIAVNPKNKKLLLIRDHREEYKEMEDEVINTIMEHTQQVIDAVKECIDIFK